MSISKVMANDSYPSKLLGGPGDAILAHYMLGHIGGNYASERARLSAYFRFFSY
jgi:hypothetical protein